MQEVTAWCLLCCENVWPYDELPVGVAHKNHLRSEAAVVSAACALCHSLNAKLLIQF